MSPQPAWVYDTGTLRFLEVNEAAVRVYGWTRDEFLRMTIRDIRPPAHQADVEALVRSVESIASHSTASTHRTKAGRTLNVEISSYPLEFAGRRARMVLVHDVTEREATARALAESEEKYRSVIEQLQDVFFRADASGAWTFLNQSWTALTGYAVDASLGTHFLSYVHPSDRTTLMDAFRPLAEGVVQSTIVEVRYFHRAGGHRWVEASARSVRDDHGRFIGTMGTLRDVTDRRAAGEERLRLANHIRQLLEASGEGIFGLDRNGTITFVNPRGSQLLGYEPSELIGELMHGLVQHSRADGTNYPILESPLHRAATHGEPCDIDDEVLWRRNGSALQVEYSASPLMENGRLAGAVVNFRDITERKRAELELIVTRDAAEAANRAKSDFLARMSHELRTPLNSIIGFANLLRKNKHGRMTDDEVSYLQRIATNGMHLLGLINDILDLSKIEAGRMALDISAVDLDALVRETIAELEGSGGGSAVLRCELPDEMSRVETDGARMKQVLINLIGNAQKFTAEGEIVVRVEVSETGAPVEISVRDTGIGIPNDRLEAIFTVFEQAESMTARRFGGTGLGLAISRSLCELMGHRLVVSSVEGKGTTMRILLSAATRPVRRTPAISTPAIPAVAHAGHPASSREPPLVLVVDDDADARLLLGQHLEEAGCRVAYASSGVDALRLARERPPALVFLDLKLPKISGLDVFRILKSDERLKSVPVVIASVVASESRNALEGAAAILDKPLSRDQVVAIVQRWAPPPTPSVA